MSTSAYTALSLEDDKKTPLMMASSGGAAVEQPTTVIDPSLMNQFKQCSLWLGLFLGFFIQLTTLGSNFLLVTSAGAEHGGLHVVLNTRRDLVLFSLTWSLFTSMMAIWVMFLLRTLVCLTHGSVANHNDNHSTIPSSASSASSSSSSSSMEYHLDHLLSNLECRYVMGALMGVCLAWAVTDILLGMNGQVVYSLIALVESLIWCKATIWFFALDKPQQAAAAPPQPQQENSNHNHNKLMSV